MIMPTTGGASLNFLAFSLTETKLVSSDGFRAVQSAILQLRLRVNSCNLG